MIEVELGTFAENSAYLIVGHNTGVEYSHQCGGYSCQQESHEGFLIPFDCQDNFVAQLYDYFYTKEKYRGHCGNGIDEADACFIDGLINFQQEVWIRVDRSMLHKCKEAWIYLKLADAYPCVPFCYGSNPESSIVLIWGNSD